MYKYENHICHPLSLDNYFIKLKSIHNRGTRQKSAGGFFYRPINSEFGRKRFFCSTDMDSHTFNFLFAFNFLF